MKIAPRLAIALGFVGAVSTVGLVALRDGRRAEETRHFDEEVASACDRIRDEVARQADNDRKLIDGACHNGEFVDRALVAMEAGMLAERRLALASLVPSQRAAFDLDALLLATDTGELLGADPSPFMALRAPEVVELTREDPAFYLHGSEAASGIVSRCRKAGRRVSLSLVGVRRLEPLVARLGKTADLAVTVESAAGAAPPSAGNDFAVASCALTDRGGASRTITVAKPKDELYEHLRQIDRTVAAAVVLASCAAMLVAFLLARGLSRPIERLAAEARKVASGEARPIRVRGTGELADLTAAFDRMIEDLESTRRRLAATSRVAAWRVAHAWRTRSRNPRPSAPPWRRRRLRARDDPAFDEY